MTVTKDSRRRIRTVPVNLGDRSYAVLVAPGLLDDVGARMRKAIGHAARNAMIVSNHTVWTLYGDRLLGSLERSGFGAVCHLIGDGERYKRLAEVERAVGAAAGAGLERGEPIVALGGGVVGDFAGLVAALYMRGTPFVGVPTTLLAQIDSSVGGKVAVNHTLGKNLIGAFHQPRAVVADPATLATLPVRELRAGLYEAVKYGVLGDARLFEWIEKRLDRLLEREADDLGRLVEWCCRIKARVVEADEREGGLRRVLNLGHTAGHALEAATRYRRFVHGEAVGYGLEVASELAAALGLFRASDVQRVRHLVGRIGPRPPVRDLRIDRLLEAMRHDKKRSGGNVPFILPTSIGSVEIRSAVTPEEVRRALECVLRGKTQRGDR
jgi:3-dehydroquinate synthase